MCFFQPNMDNEEIEKKKDKANVFFFVAKYGENAAE